MLGLSFFTTSFFRGCWCLLGVVLAGCAGPPGPGSVAPQWAADSATVRLAAGPQYARGAVWQFFWGPHYRALWATPVTVPVLRLATAVPGGLAPVQTGGSYQSHTLRLLAADGRQYVLRSVDKDASVALPAGWRRWLLGGLLKDQTSAAEPYGAYVAAQLAQAAGVYHTTPRLVYLPNDPRLGKFRAGYANGLYLLEERPEGNQRALPNFGHSPAVVNTAHLLASIRQRPGCQVVARAYLRARLLDMWLGDWSRREDQWRWASFEWPGRVEYRPIPRDRDQAFFLFDDGAVTRLVSWFVPKYHSFRATLRLGTVDGLTTTARTLDRTLLGTLSADDFRQEADSLCRRLTDAAIARALMAGPVETRAAIAARFGPVLRARRAQLPGVARRYYEILAKEAWVVGTDKAERFVVSGAGPGRLQVKMLAIRPHQVDSLVAERLYDRKETDLVNVYGLGGDDVFEILPPLKSGLAVQLYDGAGRDVVRNKAQSPEDLADVVWYQSTDNQAYKKNTNLATRSDPHPELTNDYTGWLKRYNLRD